ncbi:MAG TPA: biotin/lipoyl-binding protein [Chloroflexi bacterium]|nr:biotin/lipoyl-binding protein [Chloroflexota bacterium]
MRRTLLYVFLALVVVVVVGWAVVWRIQQTAQSPDDATRSATVERGSLLVTVSASGSIQPLRRVNLTFDTPGRVAEVLVDVGEMVRAGDVLARLDSRRLLLQVEQAQAALASAEARLAQLQAAVLPEEVASAEANLRAAEAQLGAAAATLDQVVSGARESEVAAAEADLVSAISRQASAEDAHEMTMNCFTVSFWGQEDTICPALGPPEEQARYNLNAANEALKAAQARLDELLSEADGNQVRAARSNVAAAVAQRDAAQARLDLLLTGATEGQIAAAEAQVAQAQAALQLAELAVGRTDLLAPFDGIVAVVNAKAGEMSPTQLPAVTLLDASAYHVTVRVDEIEVGRIEPGQEAQVTPDAWPDVEIGGLVERIAPAASILGGVVYYDVVIELAPTDRPIRADMTANVTIFVDELADVLLIPTWVVRLDRDTGQTYVNQRVGNEIVRTDVELGVRHQGMAQVLGGLTEGDEAIWVQESVFGFGE